MATTIETRNVAAGWNATVYEGCDSREGKVQTATADAIRKYWAVTEAAAKERAEESLDAK